MVLLFILVSSCRLPTQGRRTEFLCSLFCCHPGNRHLPSVPCCLAVVAQLVCARDLSDTSRVPTLPEPAVDRGFRERVETSWGGQKSVASRKNRPQGSTVDLSFHTAWFSPEIIPWPQQLSVLSETLLAILESPNFCLLNDPVVLAGL